MWEPLKGRLGMFRFLTLAPDAMAISHNRSSVRHKSEIHQSWRMTESTAIPGPTHPLRTNHSLDAEPADGNAPG